MKGYRISEKRSQHRCARCNQVVDRLGTESAESSQLEGNLSRHESFLRPRFASGFVGLSATPVTPVTPARLNLQLLQCLQSLWLSWAASVPRFGARCTWGLIHHCPSQSAVAANVGLQKCSKNDRGHRPHVSRHDRHGAQASKVILGTLKIRFLQHHSQIQSNFGSICHVIQSCFSAKCNAVW